MWSSFSRAGLAVDAAASCTRGEGQGGLLSVTPRLRADERRCQVRLACKFPAPSTGLGKLRRTSEPRVRQNRVVLAVVATVKPWRMRQSRQPARCRRLSRRRGRPERTRLPGEHGISRPTTAQGRPCVGLHLYAAVRFLCATFRAADRGCQPAPGLPCALLDKRAERSIKARAKSAARMRRRVCNSKCAPAPVWKQLRLIALSFQYHRPAGADIAPLA